MTNKLQNWVEKLNTLGKKRTPFLCFIDFEMDKPVVIKLSDMNVADILYDFNGVKNCEKTHPPKKKTTFKKHPLSIANFTTSFNKVQQHLSYGNSFLVNLTFPTRLQTNLTLQEVFLLAKQPYKLFVKDQFTVFSPEKFVRIKNNEIHSFPMKGTIDANIPDAENVLLQNAKEMAEHATITDLIRNDLSLVANNVALVKYRYIDKISTNQKDLLQVSTHIKGHLDSNWQNKLGDILMKLLPAGSISGAPKPKTLDIIRDVEMDKRGYYTGIMGIFDGDSFDSAVMIRYVEEKDKQLLFRSGGGITAQSNALDEYNEMVDKVYFPWKDSV